MKNFLQDGKSCEYTASGAKTSGQVVVIGERVAVLVADIADGSSGTAEFEGVHTLAKETGTAWVQGDPLFYDSGNSRFTKTGTGNIPAGFAQEAAASGDATGSVNLNGNKANRADNVAALGAPTAVTGVDGTGSNAASKADVDTRLTAIHSKIDEILTALKAAGLQKNA